MAERADLSVKDWNRILSRASEALEINSRRKIYGEEEKRERERERERERQNIQLQWISNCGVIKHLNVKIVVINHIDFVLISDVCVCVLAKYAY